MNMETQEAEVAKKLLEAFPFPDQKKLSHEECVKWRERFWRLRHEDMIILLGQVLTDLIKSRSGHLFTTQGLDMVLQFLDIYVVERDMSVLEKKLGNQGKEMEQRLAEEAQYLRKENVKRAKPFTKQQAKAVVDWLKLARTWPDTKYDLDTIDSALSYWQKHSNENF
jgi:hypothetical protein